MAEMHLCDHLEELRKIIDQQHLLYLISNERPGKLDQREKLENCIREYLYVAPHNQKFTFPQTAQVLRRSISTKENFSAHKAAAAWRAIGKYADNLVVQPWRKEFKDVKLYCGFYKHEVEENLVGAELMFEAMGYCHDGNSTMTITDILDPDRITSVSKDSIIAYVECLILRLIWESLSPQYSFTWLEILEFRENHPGTPGQAVRSLMYKRHRRQYEEQMNRRAQHHVQENHSRPDYIYGSNAGYFNHVHYPGNSYYTRFTPGMNAPQVVSPCSIYPPPIHTAYSSQQSIKPQDLYPPNGYHMQPQYTMNSLQSIQDSHSHYHSGHSQLVPTGQLIEFDSGQSNERSRNLARHASEEGRWQGSGENDSSFPSGRAKEDGAGSWENWDYVYKNLENQGYKKNLSSRREILKGNSSPRNDDIEFKVQGELSNMVKKMYVSKSETAPKDELESELKPKSGRKTSEATSETRPDGASPDKTKRYTSSGSSSSNAASIAKKNNNNNGKNTKKEVPAAKRASKQFLGTEVDDSDKWQCITCTYLNPMDKQICEMCCKSKERGDESKPQPTGGQVCTNCTLVNEPGCDLCVACNEPLKGSPTYI